MLLATVIAVMIVTNVALTVLPVRWHLAVCVLASMVLLALAWLDGLSAEDVGLGATTIPAGAAWAAVIVVVVAAGYAVATAVPLTRAAFADRRATEASGRSVTVRLLVTLPFGTVLMEETAFRGVLFGMWSARYGSTWAIVGTSALFGLWHVVSAPAMHESHDTVGGVVGHGRRGLVLTTLATLVFTALGGVVFALLRLWSNSLLPPMGLHWALNGGGLMVAWWLARSRLD